MADQRNIESNPLAVASDEEQQNNPLSIARDEEKESNPLPIASEEKESKPLVVASTVTDDNRVQPVEKESNAWTTLSTIGVALTMLASIIAFLIQQTFHLPGPRCSVVELYVPALDLSAPPPQNSTNPFIFFVLGLKNNLQIRSISYGNVSLTFFYGRKAVAAYVVPGFYQGRMKTALRRDVVETRGVPWRDAVAAVAAGATAGFRVELAARPRFKILFWYSKEKVVRIVADVAVGAGGLKAVEDDIRLHKIQHSAAPENGIRVFILTMALLVANCLLF